jgi:hypothetical protein
MPAEFSEDASHGAIAAGTAVSRHNIGQQDANIVRILWANSPHCCLREDHEILVCLLLESAA